MALEAVNFFTDNFARYRLISKILFQGADSAVICNKALVKDLLIPQSRCYTGLSLITVYVSGCSCFSEINISQSSVATHLRGGWTFYYRITTNSLTSLSVKKNLKIGQHLAKLAAKI